MAVTDDPMTLAQTQPGHNRLSGDQFKQHKGHKAEHGGATVDAFGIVVKARFGAINDRGNRGFSFHGSDALGIDTRKIGNRRRVALEGV